MEKDSLIHLISYAKSIVALRMERSQQFPQYEELAGFLAKKRRWVYITPHEEIDLDSEVKPIQDIIKEYKKLPLLPRFQKQ